MEKVSSPKIGMLFDLDGVLIDSEKAYTIFWSEMDRKYPTGFSNLSSRIKGMTLTEIFNEYFPDRTNQEEITRQLNEFELHITYEIKAGVLNLLTELQKRNIPAIMVTSSNDQKMHSLWKQHPELKGYFKHIVTADQISHSKPDPEGYLLGASIAEADPRRCAVFEDSLQGVKAGRNAGSYVVGISGTLPADAIAPYSDIVTSTLEGFNLESLLSILQRR